jgi:aminocarboxymuconate-semialdehyde decarboxylase
MDIFNHYGATVAREQEQPGRTLRPASKTIDSHVHILIPEAAAYVEPYLDATVNPQMFFASPETTALNAKQQRDRRPNLLDIDLRLADMDEAGIDMQVVMPPPPQCTYSVPVDIGIKASRMVNEGMAAFAARRPDRFAALGTVPMQDGHAAAEELERGMRELGLKGVEILTNINGTEISEPAYAPFWAKAEELGAVVLLHPLGFTEGKRLGRSYFSNIIANPLDTTLALHCLILDGVLERHPGLKILAAHGGGYLPSYSGRLDHAWGARSDVHGALPKPPSYYLKKIYFDSIVFTPHQLKYLVEVFGAGQVLLGTDYPYDMAEHNPIGHIASAGLGEAAFEAIAGGNARKLFGV